MVAVARLRLDRTVPLPKPGKSVLPPGRKVIKRAALLPIFERKPLAENVADLLQSKLVTTGPEGAHLHRFHRCPGPGDICPVRPSSLPGKHRLR
jgi:hypothetical protein